MRWIDGPGSKLILVNAITLFGTAALAAFEASKLGIGSATDIEAWKRRDKSDKRLGLKPTKPLTWFFALVCLWLVFYPWYLHCRSRYDVRSLLKVGLVSMTLWLISGFIVGNGVAILQAEVDSKAREFDRSIRELQRY